MSAKLVALPALKERLEVVNRSGGGYVENLRDTLPIEAPPSKNFIWKCVTAYADQECPLYLALELVKLAEERPRMTNAEAWEHVPKWFNIDGKEEVPND